MLCSSNPKWSPVEPAVTVIIVNYNAGAYLPQCVEALKKQSFHDFEVLLIDNASTDNSLQKAIATAADDARFSFLEMHENLGFAAANNHAAAQANTPWLATLNPDAFPEPDWLAELLQATRDHADVVMFGSMQINASEPGRLDGAGDRYFVVGIPWRDQNRDRYESAMLDKQDTYPTFAPCAAAALYRRDAFDAAGGFDPAFFCFVEDVDLGFRLRRLGHTCRQVVGARVSHVGGGAGGGESEFARYHGTRNLIWCFFKNMPAVLLIPLIPIHLVVLLILLAKATVRGQGKTVWRGIGSGIKGVGAMLKERRAITTTATVRQIASAMDWWPAAYLRHRARSR